ncbi:uncharacterized protein LOC132269415 [Cornus florida]|uniref:uncharacterized protein LOC132269415 n=1 Tax=Cornus florida TaxID=4283 RepID=UPI0028A2459B|nr:uncharacterized protein LOC132269415 [Cornus florida]
MYRERVESRRNMAATSISLSLLPFSSSSSILNPKHGWCIKTHVSSLSFTSRRTIQFHNPPHQIPLRNNPNWRISALSGDEFVSDSVENSEQIVVSAGDDGVSTIISVLLFIAFLGLSILTIGVIYIAVTDFLQKRERERFEKEESAKKKKSGKKGNVRARAGPRGFGQKIEEYDDDDE